MKVTCEYCGTVFNRKPSEIGKNIYCSVKCFAAAIKEDKTLNSNYRGGKNVVCIICGKEHYRSPSSIRKANGRYLCGKKCAGVWNSANIVGEKAHNYKDALMTKYCELCGAKFTTYHKKVKFCSFDCKSKSQEKKITVKCSHCGKRFKRVLSQVKEKNFCSINCFRNNCVGENNPCYIKDRSKLKNRNKSIRSSKGMSDWRTLVFERDNYVCALCGARSRKHNPVILNAHHIIKFSVSKKLRFEVSNGITLCDSCHKKTYGKELSYESYFLSKIPHNEKCIRERL